MKCKSCGLEKDPSLFYASNRSSCKECVKAKAKKYREENLDKCREYDRNRPNAQERQSSQSKAMALRVKEDPNYKERLHQTKRDWRDRNQPKRDAHCAANNALRDGLLERKYSCEHCLATEVRLQKHHWSYEPEHWLDVVWLCTSCHGKEHKRLNELGRDPDNISKEKQI